MKQPSARVKRFAELMRALPISGLIQITAESNKGIRYDAEFTLLDLSEYLRLKHRTSEREARALARFTIGFLNDPKGAEAFARTIGQEVNFTRDSVISVLIHLFGTRKQRARKGR